MGAALDIQQFDRNDQMNIGRPNFFNVDHWLLLIEEYITCDEVEKAMWLLENPPAWFRDHYPVAAKNLKDRLLTQFFTPVDYSKDPVADEQIGACEQDVPRAQFVIDRVKKLNENGMYPHISECAPGNYWLPFALKKADCRFTYFGPSLDPELQRRAQKKLIGHWQDKPTAGMPLDFVCFETIEHLHDPVEIYQSYLKNCHGLADQIFLSTPMYTFGGGMGDWYQNALGHLRAYTPREFHQFALKYWPEFKWKLYGGHVMCLVGEK